MSNLIHIAMEICKFMFELLVIKSYDEMNLLIFLPCVINFKHSIRIGFYLKYIDMEI